MRTAIRRRCAGIFSAEQGEAHPQRPGGTEQLAEIGRSLPHEVHQKQGQKDNENGKNDVFQLPEQLIPPEGLYFFGERDLMQKILNKPEGTQPSADEPTDHSPHEQKKSRHVKRKFEPPASDDRLQAPMGQEPRAPGQE